jgi:hypothetical protein
MKKSMVIPSQKHQLFQENLIPIITGDPVLSQAFHKLLKKDIH